MFCKIFQTFSTQNLAGQLHISQSLTNYVENFFPTFSTEATNRFPTPLAHRQLQLQTRGRPWPREREGPAPSGVGGIARSA